MWRQMLERHFTADCLQRLYSTNYWEQTDCELIDSKGKEIFKKRVEFPTWWSPNARLITASKYFTDEEDSYRTVVDRIVKTLTKATVDQKIWNQHVANLFKDELFYLLVNQHAAFNSPVYFNVGVEGRSQQCSACFLLDVDDHMESILDWIKTEGMIFKGGSGSGVNISKLRAAGERINPRGESSGPLSFMAAADCVSGIIKSGSVARRAAKMVLMDIDHPDIERFIECKVKAEEMLRTFSSNGYHVDVNSELLSFIPYQNANNSIAVTDHFMHAVNSDQQFNTFYRTGVAGTAKTYKAKELFRQICEAAWKCADPGLFYIDTVNKWHTSKESGRITTTNPCGEFVYLTWSACNLASLNLLKFVAYDEEKLEWVFEYNTFISAVKIMISAQEAIVGYASYPDERIRETTRRFRPLGLGYTNLGATLMCLGMPYDSEQGRYFASVVTSLMTATAYDWSHEIALKVGNFEGYRENKDSFKDVMIMHRSGSRLLRYEGSPPGPHVGNLRRTLAIANETWDRVVEHDGFRNGQVTLLAPTGTISFMMDCDTTGIEPELALRKTKTLVGGGTLSIVNKNLEWALSGLGYVKTYQEAIIRYVKTYNTMEGCPELKEEHLPIFDCSFKAGGKRFIRPMAHVEMVAAVQPFLSGSISKTINLPSDATIEDVEDVYMKGWKLGLKDISIYRDHTKVAQPLKAEVGKYPNTIHIGDLPPGPALLPSPLSVQPILAKPIRKKLPDTRRSVTHKFSVGGQEGYITVGMYDNGQPGELFVSISKEGSTIAGLMDAFATATSLSLQYGTPLSVMVDKFSYMRFEPSGFTPNTDIKTATSIVDYIFRWMDNHFNSGVSEPKVVVKDLEPSFVQKMETILSPEPLEKSNGNGHICLNCGNETIWAGNCRSCPTCGETSGCG